MMDVTVERVDDVPLLVRQLKEMRIAEIIDHHVKPHGNWGGISLGNTISVWLVYLVSQGDHRLCAVEEWVESMLETLRSLVDSALRPEDLSDDRLGRALNYLAQNEEWMAVEEEVDRHLLRVYELPQEMVRLDTSTVSTYAEEEEDGLVRFGFSKDHRPDIPQVKVMLATLDPLGMPLATQVVAGNRADDPLYVPVIRQVQRMLGRGKLYVGDSKMGALKTRAFIQRQGDVYLCPASRTVVTEEERRGYVREARKEGKIQNWEVERSDGSVARGEGFRVTVALAAEVDGERVEWTEERWVVRSEARYEEAVRRLEARLAGAEEKLRELNKRGRGRRRYRSQGALEERVEAILREQKVEGLLEVRYRREVQERRVRGYKGQPERVERQEDWFVEEIVRREEVLAQWKEEAGWRVYLTNGEAQGHPMGMEVVIKVYRGQHVAEGGFRRMKGQAVGITPLYVHTDAHRRGLVHLFSLALRVLTTLEYQVRRALERTDGVLRGLYEGNPKRGTRKPTGERLLKAFEGLNLSVVRLGENLYRHLSPLSETQRAILRLLGFSERAYTTLVAQSPEPP